MKANHALELKTRPFNIVVVTKLQKKCQHAVFEVIRLSVVSFALFRPVFYYIDITGT